MFTCNVYDLSFANVGEGNTDRTTGAFSQADAIVFGVDAATKYAHGGACRAEGTLRANGGAVGGFMRQA